MKVSVYRPLCGPVDGQVDRFHVRAVDVWGAVVFGFEDRASIVGQLKIVEDWEKLRLHLEGAGEKWRWATKLDVEEKKSRDFEEKLLSQES